MLVKVDDGTRIHHLNALIDMLQNRVQTPSWISNVMLCQNHVTELSQKSISESSDDKFIWTENRETLVKILANEKKLDRRILVVGKNIHTLVRLAKILSDSP